MIVPFLEVGGADKFNLDLIRLLAAEHGWDVTVAATLPGEHLWEREYERLTPDIQILERLAPVTEFPARLDEIIATRRADAVLVTHSQLGYQLLPWLQPRHPRTPFIDYLHIDASDWKNGGYPRFSLNYQPWLSRTLTSSAYLRNRLIAWGGDGAKIEVVTTNIDTGAWDPARYRREAIRERYGVAAGVPLILFSGRLDPQKQPHVLAGTLARLRAHGVRFCCLVAGDGPEREALERDIRERGLADAVRILGFRPLEEIRELLAAADIFFLPSKWEGISLAVYEAMAMETAVAAADAGGQRELVTPECGVLVAVDGRQEENYAAALAALLASPERRAAMAAAGRRRVREHFRLTDMGAAVAAALRAPAAPVPGVEAYARIHAIEIAEQARVERAGDEVWNELARLRARLSGVPGPKEHAAVVAELLLSGGTGLAGWMRTLALLFSRRDFGLKMRNLRLLARVLGDPGAARRLYEAFDPGWYRGRNPGLRASRVQPLIHYAVVGYRERRTIHPWRVPVAAAQDWPGLNPLLAAALSGDQAEKP
jgi:glycosyltransferase involved in cell wall biosynthesis